MIKKVSNAEAMEHPIVMRIVFILALHNFYNKMSSKRTTRSKFTQSDDNREEIQKARLHDLERDNFQDEQNYDSDFEIEGTKGPANKKRKTRASGTASTKSKKKGFTKRKFDKIIEDVRYFS